MDVVPIPSASCVLRNSWNLKSATRSSSTYAMDAMGIELFGVSTCWPKKDVSRKDIDFKTHVYICRWYMYIYVHPPPRAYLQEGGYHICIFIFIFQIVAHAKTTVNTSVFEYTICKIISIAIICLKRTPNNAKTESGSPFSEIRPEMKTLCTNSEVHHQKTQGKCMFSNKQQNFT